MKKVLIYNTSLSRGGAERVTVYLAEFLKKSNIECEIITERIEKNEYQVPNGIKRVVLSQKGYFSRVRELRKIIKESCAQILLVMGVPNSIYTGPASCGLPIKVIVSERNDPRFFSGKLIVKKVSQFFMSRADGYIFQTTTARDYYSKKIARKGVIIANPLFVEALPDIYVGERRKVLVNVGRLHSQKNQKMLIEAFSLINSEYPDFNLVIYGEGSLRAELESLVEAKGLRERVFMPGNRTNVLDEIKDCYAFVLSSDYEGMPNALIEAMSIGIPCISTACSGAKDLIQNGKNGILVPVGSIEELASAMRNIIDDRSYGEKIGNEAKKIREILDADVIGSKWLDFFYQIHEGKGVNNVE